MFKRYINFIFAVGGLFSPVYTSATNTENDATSITAYQYWIDDDISTITTQPYQGKEINLIFKQNDYTQGVHTLYFRVKSNNGLWSPIKNIGFYFLEKEETEQKDGKQPIIGYRYGTNGHTYTNQIAEVDKIPSLDIDIPLPSLKNVANVEDYQFTFDNSSNEVSVERNLKMF